MKNSKNVTSNLEYHLFLDCPGGTVKKNVLTLDGR